MFTLIAGKAGSGKTQRLISLANENVGTSKGHVVFIDDDKSHIHDLKRECRLITLDDVPVKSKDEFFGFLCGLISNDYDIRSIYIDDIAKLLGDNVDQMVDFAAKTHKIAEDNNIEVITTYSMDSDHMPAELQSFIRQ